MYPSWLRVKGSRATEGDGSLYASGASARAAQVWSGVNDRRVNAAKGKEKRGGHVDVNQQQQRLPYAGPAIGRSSESVTGILGLIFSVPPAAVGLVLLPMVLWARGYGGTLPTEYTWVGVVVYILFALRGGGGNEFCWSRSITVRQVQTLPGHAALKTTMGLRPR